MKKREIVRNWILILIILSAIGFLFGHFVNWQWGLGVSLGLVIGLIASLLLVMAGINAVSAIGAHQRYYSQRKSKNK